MTLLVALLSQRDPSDLRPQFNFANAIPLARMRLRSPLLKRLAPSSWSDSRKREDRFHGITLRDPPGATRRTPTSSFPVSQPAAS